MPDLFKLLQQAQQVQARMAEVQASLSRQAVVGQAGGGLVTVTADGHGAVRAVSIAPAAVTPDDVASLEDLVTVAIGEAQRRAKALSQAEMAKVTGGLDLPFPLPF